MKSQAGVTRPTRTTKFSKIRRPDTPERRARVDAIGRAMEASERLYDVRKALGITQVELATRLGVSQGSVSETERREDVFLSTLRGYIEALGGKLRVTAAFDEVEFPIVLPPVGPPAAVGPDPALTKGRSNEIQARAR